MTKKKRVTLIVVLALVLAAAIFCLWYTRPMTFEQLMPGVTDLSSCREIQIYAHYQPAGSPREESYNFTLTQDNPIFDQMLSLFEDQTYRRSLRSLLPDNGQTHFRQPGDFRWIVSLGGYESITLADGSTGSGTLFICNNFFGSLSVGSVVLNEHWRATVPNQEQWLQTVMDLIRLSSLESQ